jgi:hypothetical protein
MLRKCKRDGIEEDEQEDCGGRRQYNQTQINARLKVLELAKGLEPPTL